MLRFGLLVAMSVHTRSALAAESDAERQIQEHFRLGEADWTKSCAKPADDGACVRVKPAATGRARCSPATAAASEITVVDRDKKRAAAAKKHFESAVKLWKEGPQQNYGAATATAAAGAFFCLAEGLYEDLLRKGAPADIDLSKPAESDSEGRFTGYLTEKSRALSAARDGYLEAFKMSRAPWNVAAAARIGQTYQNFAQQLQTMAIPKAVTGNEEMRGMYCKILDDKAAPIAGKAIEAFEMCLKTANENDGRGSWSELCERELGRLKPAPPAPAPAPKPAAPARKSAAPAPGK